ncbi:MAG: hypothetical protein K0R03_2076 [Moraxellaceae bacterium]|jgi:hypothetical protein|nr:hypothetical protein [Moraxellaceae bacterium]
MTSLAQNREQHMQRFHDQLISWQEDINRLRAKTFTANSYLQGQMNKLVTQLDKNIQQLTEKLIEVAETGDRRVYSALETMESSWGTLRTNITDMMERMRNKGEDASDQLQDKASRLQGQIQDKAGQIQDKAQQVASDLGDSVQRGMNKAKQAMNEQGTGGSQGTQGGRGAARTETTISAEAGKRPQQGSGAQQMQDSGDQQGQQTQGVGASVSVTRTRSH